MRTNFKQFLIVALCCYSATLHAAVSLGTMDDGPAAIIDFEQMGQVNPIINAGGTTVSFGSAFVGQVLGSMNNEIIDSSPAGPLRLDPNAPDVMTIFEVTAMSVVLGGADNGKYLTTPLAILFEDPVQDVFFDLGHLDRPGTTRIEAFDMDGSSLGSFSNPSAAWQTLRIVDSSGDNIAGISIYVPEGGMDWEGFAIDRIGFSFSDGTGPGGPDPIIPEPGTILIWAGLGFFGLVGGWLKIRRQKN